MIQTLLFNKSLFSNNRQPGSNEILYLGRGGVYPLTDEIKTHNEILKKLSSEYNSQCRLTYIPNTVHNLNKSGVLKYFYPNLQTGFLDSLSYEDIWARVAPGQVVPEKGAILRFQETLSDGSLKYSAISVSEIGTKAFESEFKEFIYTEPVTTFSSSTGPIGHSDWSESVDDRDETTKEIERIENEIRYRIDQLRCYGVDDMVISNLFKRELKPSRMQITPDNRIILVDYDNMEIKMEPLPKSVYFLYLKHPEGIAFKDLGDYRDELLDIYRRVSGKDLTDDIIASIDRLCNPFDNSINEKCSRIRAAFLTRFDESVALKYCISGKSGGKKKVEINRFYRM